MTRIARLLALALALAALATPAAAQDAERRRGFSITITQPANQEPVLGKTKIAATLEIPEAADLDRVEFVVGESVVFVDREAPFECFHDFGKESKSWIVRAIAYHRAGMNVTDAIVTRKLNFGEVTEVNRVILWVSVTDKNEAFVSNLERSQFEVLENGKPQKLVDFYREERPITMAILLDSSGSMHEMLKEVHVAAASFVDTLRDQDTALVIDFDDRVFLIQDLTSDREALRQAVTSTEAIGGTAIFDALHASYRKLGKIEGRKAIILLSDGDDTSSQFAFKRILEQAKSDNTMIYAIGLGSGVGSEGRGVMKDFAEYTGGRAFFVNKASELAGVYAQIADELRNQFYLTYATSVEALDGRWVPIEVKVSNPSLKVRARKGFFAVPRGNGGATQPPPAR